MLSRCSVISLVLVFVICAASFCAPQSLYTKDEVVPADAIVLFDGKDLSQWVLVGSGDPASWKIQDGYAVGIGGSIKTKKEYGDCQLHLEFWLPVVTDWEGQFKANSGVFMGGAYEVQILDSYGLEPRSNECGAVYGVKEPLINACRPAEQWQTYDIFYQAPRFDAAGVKTADARVSVLHNGVWVQHNTAVPHPTADPGRPCKAPGPIEVQDHGNNQALRFRNIWIRPL